MSIYLCVVLAVIFQCIVLPRTCAKAVKPKNCPPGTYYSGVSFVTDLPVCYACPNTLEDCKNEKIADRKTCRTSCGKQNSSPTIDSLSSNGSPPSTKTEIKTTLKKRLTTSTPHASISPPSTKTKIKTTLEKRLTTSTPPSSISPLSTKTKIKTTLKKRLITSTPPSSVSPPSIKTTLEKRLTTSTLPSYVSPPSTKTKIKTTLEKRLTTSTPSANNQIKLLVVKDNSLAMGFIGIGLALGLGLGLPCLFCLIYCFRKRRNTFKRKTCDTVFIQIEEQQTMENSKSPQIKPDSFSILEGRKTPIVQETRNEFSKK